MGSFSLVYTHVDVQVSRDSTNKPKRAQSRLQGLENQKNEQYRRVGCCTKVRVYRRRQMLREGGLGVGLPDPVCTQAMTYQVLVAFWKKGRYV